MIDLVFGEIGLPATDADWRAAMRQRALAAREVLARHPWAIGLMESRSTPGAGDAAAPRRGDRLSPRGRLLDRAWPRTRTRVLDSYIYGFALQQASLPFKTSEEAVEVADSILRQFPAERTPTSPS